MVKWGGDILDITTPLVGGYENLPFDRYKVEETDHERYRFESTGQGRLRCVPRIWVAKGCLYPDDRALLGRA